MEYLVCYDIVENDVRKNVADICLNKGLMRIQYSVFFGEISKNKAEEVLMEIKDEIKEYEAIVFMVELCEKCSKKKKMVVEKKKETKKKENEELEEMKNERMSKEKQEKSEEVKGKQRENVKEEKEKRVVRRRKKPRATEEMIKTMEEKGVIVL
jgi:CRISPR-associated protein Cas2